MVRQLTPQSSLDNLKREAKRWLHALRASDPTELREARARLERSVPNARTEPRLRDVQLALAREHGFAGWAALKAHLASATERAAGHADRVASFIANACPDHHVRGKPAHVRAWHTARRLLERHPEIARDSFYTAIACGDLARVEQELTARPALAKEPGGPKEWEPLLYLCFSRAPVAEASESAVAIARLLLDHGADPNAYFKAGGSRYTPMVGAVGEGEEDRPPHRERDALARLLLERGANLYDNQVLYNTGFHGQVLWFLELNYEFAVKRGREADWADPEWQMMGMGGYGTGAGWMLTVAVRNRDLQLAEWVLAHGATPNAGPARGERLSRRSLYEDAIRAGLPEMAELFVRYGAVPSGEPLGAVEEYTAACLRLDTDKARAMVASNPDLLRAPQPMLAAANRDLADVVRFLLDLGVSPDVQNAEGERGLHMAAYANSLRVARLLLERGAEVDPVESNWSNTPLGAAVYSHHAEMIDLIGRVSRDIWELVYVGNVERVRAVLRERPELAKTSSGGHTPLMWLPPDDELRALEIAKLLIAHGADPSLRNKEGETAADRARRLGMIEVASYLDSLTA
jgi:ankyrin repeat protein